MKKTLLSIFSLAAFGCISSNDGIKNTEVSANNSDPKKANYTPDATFTHLNNSDPLKTDFNPGLILNEKIEASPEINTLKSKTLKKLGSSLSSYSYPVGVVPHTDDECYSSTYELKIYMDDEDSNNGSKIEWPDNWSYQHVPYGFQDDDSDNTGFVFCLVEGADFLRFQKTSPSETGSSDYAVLKLGDDCPPGSLEFKRKIDNEDSGNENSSDGDISPNVSNNNTTLYFCYFPETTSGGMTEFPGASTSTGIYNAINGYYAVFAPENALTGPNNNPWDHYPYVTNDKGYIYSDDEDSGNSNSWTEIGSGWTTEYKNRAKKIISSGSNTKFFAARANSPD